MVSAKLLDGRGNRLLARGSELRDSLDAFARADIQVSPGGMRQIRPDGVNAVECAVISPEDLLLRKLEWYRAGGETSERQWNDVRGVRRATGGQLDFVYLRHWSARLRVDDLLDRLLAEFGL